MSVALDQPVEQYDCARLIAEIKVLRSALRPFAEIEIEDEARGTQIVPNGYPDPRVWDKQVRTARAVLTDTASIFMESKAEPISCPECGVGRPGHEISCSRALILELGDREREISIPDGMKRWYGGDASPKDWQGTDTLLRNGVMASMKNWPGGWKHRGAHDDIVAYTPAPQSRSYLPDPTTFEYDKVKGIVDHLKKLQDDRAGYIRYHLGYENALRDVLAALSST